MSDILLLIKAEMKRIFLSPNYLLSIILLLSIRITRAYGWIPVFNISYGFDFLDNTILICLLVSLSFSTYIIMEFKNRTIYNKKILGYSNACIYSGEAIALSIASTSIVLFDNILYILGILLRRESSSLSFQGWIINTLIFSCSIGCITIIVCTICFFVKRNLSILFCIILAITLLESGRSHVATLTEYYSLFTETHQETSADALDLMKNYTSRPSTESEKFLSKAICLSPYEQCYFATYISIESYDDKTHHSFFFNSCPYHIDFIIVDEFITVLTIFITTILITKKDL